MEILLQMGTVDCAFIVPGQPPPVAVSWLSAVCDNVYWVTRQELQSAQNSALFRRLLPKRPGEDIEFFLDAERYRWREHRASTRLLGDLTRYDMVVSRYLQSALNFGLHRHQRWLLDVDDYTPDRIQARLPLVNPHSSARVAPLLALCAQCLCDLASQSTRLLGQQS
ncbi:MAG: hypothetical protein LR015_05555 [Verrucomicrobia bacterium]|nr:hypothetical protein [Verrucomicrobiota bacterium]